MRWGWLFMIVGPTILGFAAAQWMREREREDKRCDTTTA